MFKALMSIFSKKQSEIAEIPVVKQEVKEETKVVMAKAAAPKSKPKTTAAKPAVKKPKTKK